MKQMKHYIRKLACATMCAIMIMTLASCGSTSNPDTKVDSSDSENVEEETPVVEDTFVSDFEPGEENRVGNIWSNTTLCSQGNYVYHYNEKSNCFEKWMKSDEPESAEQISSQSDVEGHIEVVGDYIYFCQQGSETVGKDKLYNIQRMRTDGGRIDYYHYRLFKLPV